MIVTAVGSTEYASKLQMYQNNNNNKKKKKNSSNNRTTATTTTTTTATTTTGLLLWNQNPSLSIANILPKAGLLTIP
jgi:hypothetical protein